jgi:hypothetical protein
MGTDERIIKTSSTRDIGDSNKKGWSIAVDDYKNVSSSDTSNTFWVVIRHNLREN